MQFEELGRNYEDGEIIVSEGEPGDTMYVILSGRASVSRNVGGHEVRIAELGRQDIFGEMALFERSARSATVRALGRTRVMSVDKPAFLRRVHQDPSLAYRILQQLSARLRAMDSELASLKQLDTAPPAVDAHAPRAQRPHLLSVILKSLRKPATRR